MTDEVHDRIRDYWDRDSHTYDETRSHSISDPLEAAAWRQALADALPEPGTKVLDVGAGTGALSLLAAELGHEVTALDLSPGMLGRAELKAKERGLEERMRFVVGSGTEPPRASTLSQAASVSSTAKYTIQWLGRSVGHMSPTMGIIPPMLRSPTFHSV